MLLWMLQVQLLVLRSPSLMWLHKRCKIVSIIFTPFHGYYFLTHPIHGLDSFIDLTINNFGGILEKVANIKRFHAAVNITKSGITEALLEFDITVVGQEISGSFQTSLKWSAITEQLLPLITKPISDLFNAIKNLRKTVSK